MRIFIAINFDDTLKSYLQEKQNEFRLYCNKGNFSHKENFHLTLKFIGEVEQQKISDIQKAMDISGDVCEEFELNLNNLGAFKRQNEYTPWIGLEGDLAKLNSLYQRVQLELNNIGIPREDRSLKPHITLGRRIQLKESFDRITKNISIDKKLIDVNIITLMESRRIAGKLTYIPLYEKKLVSKD